MEVGKENTLYFKNKDNKEGFIDGMLSCMLFFVDIRDTETSKCMTEALRFNNNVLKGKNIIPEQLTLPLNDPCLDQ